MTGQAILRFELIGGGIAPAEVVTLNGRCDRHEDCVRVIHADGHPAWASSGELEVIA